MNYPDTDSWGNTSQHWVVIERWTSTGEVIERELDMKGKNISQCPLQATLGQIVTIVEQTVAALGQTE